MGQYKSQNLISKILITAKSLFKTEVYFSTASSKERTQNRSLDPRKNGPVGKTGPQGIKTAIFLLS